MSYALHQQMAALTNNNELEKWIGEINECIDAIVE